MFAGATPLRLETLNRGKKGSQTQISFYGLACTWATVQIRWSADKKGSSESAVVSRLQNRFCRFLLPHNQITHQEIRTTAQLRLSAAPSLPRSGHIFHILFTLTPPLYFGGFICQKGEQSRSNRGYVLTLHNCLVFVSTVWATRPLKGEENVRWWCRVLPGCRISQVHVKNQKFLFSH